MSLLYECINGIIQGGLLEGQDDLREGDQIASLCVSKLRSMIIVDGDPNLKYVSLLAFNKIARSHSHLVFEHEDVITACIDDPDVSIRLQALDLIAGIANSDNLVAIIERLLAQLEGEPNLTIDDGGLNRRRPNQSATISVKSIKSQLEHPALPVDYKLILIRAIIDISSKSMYTNVNDFDWYINVLLRLFQVATAGISEVDANDITQRFSGSKSPDQDVFCAIGWQLRNVAVRVEAVRSHAVLAALSLLDFQFCSKSQNILSFATWIIGEYIGYNRDSTGALESLLRTDTTCFSSETICHCIQAMLKVFAHCLSEPSPDWDTKHYDVLYRQRRQIILYLSPLANYRDLEVQERAVGFLELLKVTDSLAKESGRALDQGHLLLAQFLPQLFKGFEINPVAPSAQKKVPLQSELDLQANINKDLATLLELEGSSASTNPTTATFNHLYHVHSAWSSDVKLQVYDGSDPLQHVFTARSMDNDAMTRTRDPNQTDAGRQSEDPFYLAISSARSPGASPSREISLNGNEDSLDIDSIPIMNLDVEPAFERTRRPYGRKDEERLQPSIQIVQDLDIEGTLEPRDAKIQKQPSVRKGGQRKRSPLGLDTIDIDKLALTNSVEKGASNEDGGQDIEMANALAEVERLRLEMQRASDRVEATDGAPAEGTLIKKRTRRKIKRKSGKPSLPMIQANESANPTDQPLRRERSEQK